MTQNVIANETANPKSSFQFAKFKLNIWNNYASNFDSIHTLTDNVLSSISYPMEAFDI